MRLTLGLAAILFTTILAGCVTGETADAPEITQQAAPAEFDEETGAIEGVVVDDSLVPIPGAVVGLHGNEEFLTETDDGGAFSFSKVPPGTHTILAQKIGFQTLSKAIDVPVGAVTPVELVLTPVPIDAPYYETHEQRGLFGCGSSWRPSLGVPGVLTVGGVAACGVTSLVLNDTTYDNFLLHWETSGNDTEDWEAAVFEMSWTSNQVFGSGMAVYWEVEGCSNNRTGRFALERGDSPLRARLAGPDLDDRLLNITTNGCGSDDCEAEKCQTCDEDKCRMHSRVFSDPDTLGPSAPADIGVTFQQTFQQFFTEFYIEEGPAEFTALDDS